MFAILVAFVPTLFLPNHAPQAAPAAADASADSVAANAAGPDQAGRSEPTGVMSD